MDRSEEKVGGQRRSVWKRVAQAKAKKKRELHDRRVERLQWSLIRLKVDIADTSARLEYQQKLGAELDARLDAAVAAL